MTYCMEHDLKTFAKLKLSCQIVKDIFSLVIRVAFNM